MLPQLHRHAWMDEDIAAFREQCPRIRRYIALDQPVDPALLGVDAVGRRAGGVGRQRDKGGVRITVPPVDGRQRPLEGAAHERTRGGCNLRFCGHF